MVNTIGVNIQVVSMARKALLYPTRLKCKQTWTPHVSWSLLFKVITHQLKGYRAILSYFVLSIFIQLSWYFWWREHSHVTSTANKSDIKVVVYIFCIYFFITVCLCIHVSFKFPCKNCGSLTQVWGSMVMFLACRQCLPSRNKCRNTTNLSESEMVHKDMERVYRLLNQSFVG